MARPDQEAIDTFISITGASESVAVQALQAHGGDLNQAVNAHFSEGDRNSIREVSTVTPQDDAMDIDEAIPVGTRAPPVSLFPSPGNLNLFSLLDPDLSSRIFDGGPLLSSPTPFVSHPREVREIPIEVKDGGGQSGHSRLAPTIEDISGTDDHGPETHGMVTMDDGGKAIPNTQTGLNAGLNGRRHDVADVTDGTYPSPSAPEIDDLPAFHNDIEEEMVRAAIEASKKEVGKVHKEQLFDGQETAEQEKVLQELGGSSEPEACKSTEMGDTGKRALLNGRLNEGRSSVQDETEDVEEPPLVRRRSRRIVSASASACADSATEIDEIEVIPPSSPRQPDMDHPLQSGSDFPEWGGISSEEHDEAVMLEAAMFGGIPETSGYHFPYASHHFMQNGLDRNSAPYSQQFPRPQSPSLVAQRLIREQQDDEYLASLQADREKAEARRLEEELAREASLEAERRKEEESRRKWEAEREIERQLTAKEASLPPVPSSDDENAVTLLVKMPDGSRRGRRFLKSDKLQYLFDFIDVGRGVKPSTYKLVRPYPRRAFSDEESSLSLNELGLTSKQEALFLELIKP